MATARFRFERFELDPGNRRLSRDGAPVELNARYLDALVLLAGEQGRLVSKDRFLDEVWRGVPVTDEALTQCIRTLRRQLGDDAANPRFIETVPKHGYRFLAAVEIADSERPVAPDPAREPAPKGLRVLALGAAGTAGGAAAGLVGGLLYGFAGASQPVQPGIGALSVMLVVVAVTTLVGLVGAAGVSYGIALAGMRTWYASVLGGAAGGLLTGAAVKLLGIDAFNLLIGRAPAGITGAAEGVVLGGAVGLGAWLAGPATAPRTLRFGAGLSALAGGTAGAVITLLGGRLMAGSLDLLARSFPDSRLRLDPIGGLFGEAGFGPVSQVVTGALEGALFGGCVVAAMIVARRTFSGT
jgi:DNA-binding winged helix-turn-helix (wHTH) protein